MRQRFLILCLFLFSFECFSQSGSDNATPVTHIIKFNIGSLIFQNINLSYERFSGMKKSWELGISRYFPSNVDNGLGPYIMNVHYKGYGFDICRKQHIVLSHGSVYYGAKFTFKYKYFDHEHVLVRGKAEESDGQEYTVASNKKMAESICLTAGLCGGKHFFADLYVAIGISVITNNTDNYYSYNPGAYSRPAPPLREIPRSNSTYAFPEFQFGFKIGPAFRKKDRTI